MSKKKTHEEYVDELQVKNLSVETIEQYINAITPIMHRCKTCGHEWYTKPNNILSGFGCPKCAHNIKKTYDEYVAEVYMKNPDIEILEKYIDAKTPILHKCKKHNVIWNCSPGDILNGKGCNMCRGEKIRVKLQKTQNQYIEDVKNINPDIIVLGQYVNNKTEIEHYCKICGCKWYSKPDNILSGKGCPQCHESSGERQIRQWLQSNHIQYTFQQTFNNCKAKNLLPFDFYLPEYNACVEYDGEQHFRPVDFWGGKDGFEKQQLHDKMKNQYCQNNNIHLLRIPYFKNIEEELEKFLFI